MLSPIDFIHDLLNPDLRFLPKALLVSMMASVVAGVIGSYVVLRGMAFIGDAVAHAVFPGLAVAFVIQGNLVLGGAVAGVATAILVAIFSQNRRLKEDSVIGVFFVGAFALGIVIISRAPGYSGSLQQFLFGSITGIPDRDVIVVAAAGGILLLTVFLLHKEFVAVTLDRETARAIGLPVLTLDLVLYVMVAIAIVISIQTIGNILVLALLITPAAAARFLTDRLGVMMFLAPIIGAVSALIGLYLSWSLDLPAGGTIVLVATAVFLLAWLLAPRHGLMAKRLRRQPNTSQRDDSQGNGRKRRLKGAIRVSGASMLALLISGILPLAPPVQAAADPVASDTAFPGQSDQPAPESREKLVLDHGHIDAFTLVLNDDGSLRLAMKEDVTSLNTLREPESVLLHVKSSARTTLPPGYVPGLSGEAYHLPLIQDPDLIWPGWETQLITSAYPDADTKIVVSDIQGPGDVFLWSQDTYGAVRSLLLGGYRLPATISQPYPAHSHAAWAFTEAGSYTFTVHAEVSASNGRTARSQTAEYTFVVGELDAHLAHTSVELTADTGDSDPWQPVTFTARVTAEPAGESGRDVRPPVGAVQFRSVDSDAILGHTPVGDDGTASFRTAALPPGEHNIVAEFVPTWSDDFAASNSKPLRLNVSGERSPKPDRDDSAPVSNTDIDAVAPATVVQITSKEKQVRAGGRLSAVVEDVELSGQWVSVWLHDKPKWLGWAQLDLVGGLSISIPDGVDAGRYRLVVKSRDGEFVGWDGFTVQNEDEEKREPTPMPELPSTSASPAARQECQPSVTLDHGHIDAFTVSAGGGLAVLQLLEDVTGHRVLREAETVLLRVKESAYASIPGLPGGPAGYVLPLSQNQQLIWPGWDTNRTTASGFTDVRITVTGVSGPGEVFLYTSQGAFGGWRSLLTHGGYRLPGTIHEPSPAHTHAQWVFSQRGVYVLTAHAVASNPNTGVSLTTASHDYVFQVGDVPLGDVFCGLSAHGARDAELVDAAVTQASFEAVAAQQAGEAQRAKQSDRDSLRLSASGRGEEDAVDTLFGVDAPPAVIAGIVAGAVFSIAGIVGGTVWWLRRLREVELRAGS